MPGMPSPSRPGSGKTIPVRAEIDDKYKWRLTDIYATDEEWEADLARFAELIPSLAPFSGSLSSGASLLAGLQQKDRVDELQGKLFVYASMRHDEDTRNDRYTAMRDRIRNLGVRWSEAGAFFEPELLAVPREVLQREVDATPGLKAYRHYLDNLHRQQEHTLSADKEELLAAASDVTGTFANVFGAFNNADLTYGTMTDEHGEEVELTKGRYRRFQESSDRRVRRESWNLFYRAYETFGNTLAGNLAGNIKSHIFNAKARNYPSALHAALDQNAIPVEVYHNLIETVGANLEPLHRYVRLRKRLLAVDTLHVWDMAAPLVDTPPQDIPFEEAVRIVTDGVQPLGPQYAEPFAAAFDDGWIDVFETQGKRGGAYSWGSYATKPYLLLNYNGTLDSVFTLTHEMGHSMHSYLTRKHQPYHYGNYSIFVAEVASTTNEALLIEKLLRETGDPVKRLSLLNHYLEQIRGTFFTQALFAEVELSMHRMAEEGTPLTKASLDELYNETYRRFFGPEVETPPLNGSTWSRIPHFYYNFYVYQYATSYIAATALAEAILENRPGARDRFLAFLRSGSTKPPVELLADAGVDMTSPEPIRAAMRLMNEVIDRIEALLDERARG